jgi:hypothetical protein
MKRVHVALCVSDEGVSVERAEQDDPGAGYGRTAGGRNSANLVLDELSTEVMQSDPCSLLRTRRLSSSPCCVLTTPNGGGQAARGYPALFMTVRRKIAEPSRETGARSREDPMRTRAVR